MIIGKRTSCRPIWSVIILVMKQIRFVNHSYDYQPNWTLLSPITIINRTGPCNDESRNDLPLLVCYSAHTATKRKSVTRYITKTYH